MASQSDWTLLHARVHRTLRSRGLVSRGQHILVAVSGGQDSLCLAKLLLDLQPRWNWQLAVAHCNHQWRDDATANAAYVEQLARAWNVRFHCQTTPQVLASEAAAREWRYQTLRTIAQDNNYSHVVTGHTASDRAETLLYNLTRGSGTDGLQALTWQRMLDNIVLVRPLLAVTRAQTAQFCQQMHLQVWEDRTNQDLKYARNRIRQELLPYLQHHFNPHVEQNLAQTAEILQAEVEYLEFAAQQLRQQVQAAAPPNGIKLNCEMLRAAPLALQRRVIRQVLQQIITNVNFAHIEKVTALIAAPNGSQTDPLPGGTIAQVSNGWILIDSRLPHSPQPLG